MALIAPHWIPDLATGKAFTVQTDLHSSLSVHELVVVITSHEIFAGEDVIDDVFYFLDGDEEDGEEIKLGLALLGRVIVLGSEDYFQGDRLMAVFNKLWKSNLCMFRCFLKVAVTASVAI